MKLKYSKTYPLLFIVLAFLNYSCTEGLIGEEGSLDEDIYLNYQTKTDLEIPFEDEWYMAAAGRTHMDGAHHFITRGLGQRYAFDAYININGSSHTGGGTKNEDYHCFGKRLNAPGSGRIIAMQNDEEDILPGTIYQGSNSFGNHVIIDHLNGEYSFLAHFMKGSIVVSVGDMIVKGQELGKTGNSGNSTQPHLHYHLQDSPRPQNGMGLPAQFRNYFANGKLIPRGEPVRNQSIKK